MRVFLLVSLVVGGLALGPQRASSHPGGLAADGCHNDRKNGGRHCHGGSSSARSSSGQRSSSGGLRAFGGASFRNCREARAAGAAPVRRGDAGYASHLDRDDDGVGCE